ncbi:MAG: TonB-dependent receptor [Ignavibacteriaceae bacterium]
MILRKILLTFIFTILTMPIFYAQTGEIAGDVKEKDSKQPLIGASVVVNGTNYGASTDINGYYRIINIPVGIYNVTISYVGYETVIQTDVIVKSGKNVRLNAELKWKQIENEEVVVVTGYFNKLEDSPISSHSLNNEEIRRSPGTREDVSRMLQNFPGVNFTSDDRNDLVIRGGSPVEVQFLVDNIEIPNPNHFGTQGATGGPIGMINTEFIEKANFYSGGFTSGYGSKLSGVMDINLRNGSKDNFGGKVDLNFGGTGFYLEAPFGDNKGSYLISAHRSFLELFKDILDFGGTPVYTNTQGKINYNFNPSQQISFLWLGGDDMIDIDYDLEVDDFETGKIDTNYYNNVKFRSRQLTVGSNLKSFWSNNFYTQLTASHTYSKFKTDIHSIDLVGFHNYGSGELSGKQEINNNLSFSNISTEQVSNIKLDASWIFNKTMMFTWGGYIKRNMFNYKILYVPPHPEKPNEYGQVEQSWGSAINYKSVDKYGGFINLKQNLFDLFTINAGLRVDRFDLINEISFSPRFTLLYDISNNLSLHAGYGKYYQNPEYIWITTSEENKFNLNDMRSDHYIVGLNYLITPGLRLLLEAYYKNYFEYPVASETGYEMISMANSGAEYGVNLLTQKLISAGKGYSKGIDIMFHQKMTDSYYGILSYSYSKTENKALDNILRPGAFDNRNVLNIVLGYQFSKEDELSLKFKYAGGRPYTPFEMNKSIETGEGVLDLNRINTERYDDYQRLDLRYDERFFFKWGTLTTYISIENILGKKNVLNHYWNGAKRKTDFTYQTTMFFVGGVSLEF